MKESPIIFTVPTYRLRDVVETIEKYDEHFARNGHSVKMMVFDDSSLANHEKYYALLEQTKTVNDLYYVGPREKKQFLGFLNRRLRDKKLDSLVRNLFRPSYGGNRNFTLMYSLGAFLVSADDDMRPHALIESSPESLNSEEISRGKLMKATGGGFVQKSFDLLAAFKDVLGRRVGELPGNYERGELLVDTAMDLETNVSNDFAGDNSLLLKRGPVSSSAVVKMAQTFRTGTNDIDALDYVQMYRLWIQQPGIAAAHVDAVQTHTKNNYMRNPLAMDVFNEELCTLLKKKIKGSVTKLDDLTIRFGYNGEVTLKDTQEILDKITEVNRQVVEAAGRTKDSQRREALTLFAENLARSFYGFEPDFFQQNVTHIVDDVVSVIHASLELWPTLVETCYFHKDKKEFPQIRVKNKKLKSRNGAAPRTG